MTLEAQCVEWTLLLGVLLLDTAVISRTVECSKKHGGIDGNALARIVQGAEELYTWAESEW